MCSTSTETIRLIRDGEKARGEGGMEVGAEREIIYLSLHCHRQNDSYINLRWAAMRTILIFHNCEGQSHKTVSADHNLGSERIAETDLN